MRYVSGHSVSGHIYPVCKTSNTHQMQSLRYGIMVTASVAMMLASCTNDDFPGNENLVIASDRICFGISPDKVEVGRRSVCYDASVCVDTLVLRSDFSTDTLCAEVIVTDNISSSSFDAGLSRGVPVTQEDFYDKFHVLAYWRKSGALEPRFYINDDVTDKGGNLWSTGNVYYWMDAQQSLQFYAWAPTDAGGLTTPMTPQSTTLNYTVPLAAMEQKDIVVAKTEELPGNNNAVVPLSFNHVCAGVRFVVGDRMQAGSIKSVALYGVKNTGIYDMSVSTWTLGESTADFSQQLNITTTGNESDGTQITTAEGTFMMLPQTLGADAQLTVVFHDDVTGEDRTLTSSLAGRTWPQGKVTTYRIGISKQYDLNISAVETQDAHYVICNSEISIEGLPAGKSWTLTASASDGADVSVQLTSEVNEFVKQGFWTDKEMNNGTPTDISARGTNTIKGSGPGSFPITVFLPENVSDDQDRTVSLKLSVDGAPEKDALTYSFTQVHPLWNNGTGWEQIDDNLTGAYGFMYTAQDVFVYNYWSTRSVIRQVESSVQQLVEQYSASAYVEYDTYMRYIPVSYRMYVAIDYSKLSNLNYNGIQIASSRTDGLNNTIQLFDFGGSAVSKTFVNALMELKKVQNGDVAFRERADNDPSDVPQQVKGDIINASQILTHVLKKNRYYLNNVSDDEMTTMAPKILAKDIKWYLPAYQQFNAMPGTMSASLFWSSTAYSDAAHSYTGGGTLQQRDEQMKIRVARNSD